MEKIIEYLMGNKVAQIIGAIVVGIVFVILVIAGIGFLSSLLMILLIALVIYFGSIRELAGSVVTVILVKTFFLEIKEVLTIWTSSPKVILTCDFIQKTGYIKLILVIFFFAFLLKFFTGSIKLFNITVNNKNVTEKPDDKSDDKPKEEQKRR